MIYDIYIYYYIYYNIIIYIYIYIISVYMNILFLLFHLFLLSVLHLFYGDKRWNTNKTDALGTIEINMPNWRHQNWARSDPKFSAFAKPAFGSESANIPSGYDSSCTSAILARRAPRWEGPDWSKLTGFPQNDTPKVEYPSTSHKWGICQTQKGSQRWSYHRTCPDWLGFRVKFVVSPTRPNKIEDVLVQLYCVFVIEHAVFLLFWR